MIVVLDANVVFNAAVRDTLLRCAEHRLIRVFWSERILDEAFRNLVAQQRTTAERAQKLKAQLNAAFPDAIVTGYESLEADMTNQRKDRHVAAAALHSGASFIVTSNVRDFEPAPAGIKVVTPDELLVSLVHQHPSALRGILEDQAAALANPPTTFDQLLAHLEKSAPRFVAVIRAGAR